MRRGNLFWGIILIVFGILFLLNTLGILKIDVWGLIWPSLLIVAGIFVLWNVLAQSQHHAETRQVAIPLEGAAAAEVRIEFGAGALKIGSQSNPAELVNGTFEGGLDYKTDRDGDTLKVKLSAPPGDWWTFPWMLGQYQRQWSLGLNNQVPLKLRLEAGAAESNLDLSGLRLTELKLEIGASSTNVTLPAQAGFTKAKVSAGAASTTLRIPSGVAARIRFEGGAASFEVDSARFPRVNGYRQSPDYETAANKVDLDIEGGAGSFVVR